MEFGRLMVVLLHLEREFNIRVLTLLIFSWILWCLMIRHVLQLFVHYPLVSLWEIWFNRVFSHVHRNNGRNLR